MKKYLLLGCFCLNAFFLSGQTTNISGIINTYVDVTATTACSNQLVVSSATGFAVGDTVLVIQMKGATIDESNSASFGSVSAYNGSGRFEKAIIAEISSNILKFTKDLVNTYNIPAGKVQIVSIPQYVNANVNAALTCADWNGTTGGVLIFEASGTVTLNATVDVSGRGFLGAANTQQCPNSCSFSTNWSDYFYAFPNYRAAYKGEGIAAQITGKELGRGAQGNGGGGGNDHNNGGAGGAGYAAGGQGGNNAEPGGFNCKGSNNYGRPGIAPAFGATPDRLFLGGGGGAGHGNNGATGGCPNNGNSGIGGDGGGIIIITAGTFDGNGGVMRANGNACPGIANGDGGGGGGGGGIVCLNVGGFSPWACTIEVRGGAGGNTSGFGGNRCYGPGGGGGGGAVFTNMALPMVFTVTATGGAPGIVTSSTNVCNGTSTTAQAGTAGTTVNSFVLPAGTIDPSGGCLTIEPVEFMEVNALPYFQQVNISWKTASESQNDKFEVERSTTLEEKDFKKIGEVDGAGNSAAIRDYDFEDKSPVYGTSYYRIRQVDFEGTHSYSEIVRVNFNGEIEVITAAYPNPVRAGVPVSVDFSLPGDEKVFWSIHDMLGREIFSGESEAERGTNSILLPTSGLSPGAYLITLRGNGFRDDQRFFIAD